MFIENDAEMGCAVEDVMVFFTGSNRVPPTGFKRRPTVQFQHHLGRKLATASTCDLVLTLPVGHGSNYDGFKNDFILAVKGNDGFGGP